MKAECQAVVRARHRPRSEENSGFCFCPHLSNERNNPACLSAAVTAAFWVDQSWHRGFIFLLCQLLLLPLDYFFLVVLCFPCPLSPTLPKARCLKSYVTREAGYTLVPHPQLLLYSYKGRWAQLSVIHVLLALLNPRRLGQLLTSSK